MGEEEWYKRSFSWEKERLQAPPHRKTVRIGNDAWIGNNVTIYEGVTIGDGCIINSGSIITQDVLPYSVIDVNSGEKLKRRFSKEDITLLEQVAWWDLPLEIINRIDKNNFRLDIQRLSNEKYPKSRLDKAIINSQNRVIEILGNSNKNTLYVL